MNTSAPTSPPASTENKLTSDRYAEFVEALDMLYIKNNISGRNNFSAAWPDAAAHIFGEELQRYDRDGTQDREHRAILENEAEDRRFELLEVATTLEEKSVDKGVLQIEYVQGQINRLGRKLALSLYSRWLVDRFIPPPPEEMVKASSEAQAPQSRPAPPKPIDNPNIRPISHDAMDRIKPISVDSDMSPPPQEEKQELIIETEGARPIEIAAQQQESLAPVIGASKKPGLKITGISEGGKTEEQLQDSVTPPVPDPNKENPDEEEDPPLFPEPIKPQGDNQTD